MSMRFEYAISRRLRRVGNEYISKSASKAADMPTDHLPKHGSSACSQTLYLTLSGGVNEYLRGGWENLWGCLRIFGDLGNFTGN